MVPGSAFYAQGQIQAQPGAVAKALSWILRNRLPSFRSKAAEYVCDPDPLGVRCENRSSAHVDPVGSALLTARTSRRNPDFARRRPREQLSNQSRIRRAAVDTEGR